MGHGTIIGMMAFTGLNFGENSFLPVTKITACHMCVHTKFKMLFRTLCLSDDWLLSASFTK